MASPVLMASPDRRAVGSRALYLDAFRGIACLMVFYFHYALNLGVKVGGYMFGLWGFTGVHLFFILSGYLLFQPFLKAILGDRPFPSVKGFYQRRFIRIYPPFFVSLLIYVGLRKFSHTNVPDLHNIIAHAAMVSNYIDPKLWYSINPVYWSLAIEMQFYVLLPLLCLLFSRGGTLKPENRAFALVAFTFALGVAARTFEFFYWRSHGPTADTIYFRSIFSYLDLFAVGMLIAVLRREPLASRLRARFPLPGLVLSGVVVLLSANLWCTLVSPAAWLDTPNALYTVGFPVVVCAAWGMILIAVILNEGYNPGLLNRGFLIWAGQISYSIYLYHVGVEFCTMRVIHLSYSLGWDLRNILYTVITLPLTLAVAAIMYYLVERPCVNWLSKPRSAELNASNVEKALASPPVL